MKNKKCIHHWQSNFTGEIVTNFWEVIKTVCFYIGHIKWTPKFFDWGYSKTGF